MPQPELRQAVRETVLSIAGQCDGIRCDMAMLLLNSIFERTWGSRAGTAAGNRILARPDSCHQKNLSRLPLCCRSLLGPRVGAATTRLRLLLRQAALRPAGA